MDLIALNKNFQVIGYLPYINLQWNRKYYECGDFSVQVLVTDYVKIKDAYYLYTPDRPELGIIEKLHTDTDITGHYVQIMGQFAERLLEFNVVQRQKKGSFNPVTLVKDLVTAYPPDSQVYPFTIGTCDAGSGLDNVDVEYFCQGIDEVTWALLKECERSQRIYYDFDNNTLVYEIWIGLDRTQSQDTNNYAFFSDIAQNVERISIDEDDSGFFNYCIVAYTSNGTKYYEYDGREFEQDGVTRKGPKRIKMIDQTSGSKTAAERTQAAKDELAKWKKVNNIQANTLQNGLLYLVDYDLGDKCDIVSNEMERSYETRIIEVHEVFKEGQHTVELVFGEKFPTDFERVRNK